MDELAVRIRAAAHVAWAATATHLGPIAHISRRSHCGYDTTLLSWAVPDMSTAANMAVALTGAGQGLYLRPQRGYGTGIYLLPDGRVQLYEDELDLERTFSDRTHEEWPIQPFVGDLLGEDFAQDWWMEATTSGLLEAAEEIWGVREMEPREEVKSREEWPVHKSKCMGDWIITTYRWQLVNHRLGGVLCVSKELYLDTWRLRAFIAAEEE